MKKIDDKKFAGAIIRRYMWQFLVQVVTVSFGVVLFALVCYVLAHTVIWYDTNPMYHVLKAIEHYIIPIVVALWIGGMLVVLALQWRKAARSFLELAATISRMRLSEDANINLPEELRELEEMLEDVQLQALENKRRAQESEQRKNDMLVYLAHDLKTPLTSIIGYLSLLQEEPQLPDKSRRRYVDIAAAKALRLGDLIDEFFEIARYSGGGMALMPGRLNFGRMLRQIVDEFGPMLAQAQLQCRLAAEEDLFIYADAGKLERVLDNLLRNAILYSPPGGEIEVCARVFNGRLEFSIQNPGEDIPPEKLKHIFEQFYRVNTARTASGGGAGLGLAIAGGIVALHGGEIFAESANGLITLRFWLPAKGENEAQGLP